MILHAFFADFKSLISMPDSTDASNVFGVVTSAMGKSFFFQCVHRVGIEQPAARLGCHHRVDDYF